MFNSIQDRVAHPFHSLPSRINIHPCVTGELCSVYHSMYRMQYTITRSRSHPTTCTIIYKNDITPQTTPSSSYTKSGLGKTSPLHRCKIVILEYQRLAQVNRSRRDCQPHSSHGNSQKDLNAASKQCHPHTISKRINSSLVPPL